MIQKKKKRRGNWGGGDVIVFVGVSAENITVCCEFDSRVYKRINVLTILSLSLVLDRSVICLINRI